MLKELNQDLLDELNNELDDRGYCFNFMLDSRDNPVARSFLKNAAGLDSYIINIDNHVLKYIEMWFYHKGYKITWNNSGCIFWISSKGE